MYPRLEKASDRGLGLKVHSKKIYSVETLETSFQTADSDAFRWQATGDRMGAWICSPGPNGQILFELA